MEDGAAPRAAAALTLMLFSTVVWPRGQRSVRITLKCGAQARSVFPTRVCVCILSICGAYTHTHTPVHGVCFAIAESIKCAKDTSGWRRRGRAQSAEKDFCWQHQTLRAV